MSGKLLMGPVLGFRGIKDGCWCTSALVVQRDTPEPPQLTFSVLGHSYTAAKTVLLKIFNGYYLWRLEWSVKQNDTEQTVNYTVNGGQPFQYVVPATNLALRISYGSCFGVHNLQDVNKVKNKNALWKNLQKVHQQHPYHLFFLGGDQIYSDSLWENVPALRHWLNIKLKKRLPISFTDDMQRQVAQFYFELYLQMWQQKLPAAILSQIPTLMMWDDHNIFDGWGSYEPALQNSPVFKGIYNMAREHFRLFQLQAKHDDDLGEATLLGHKGFSYAYRLGDLAIVALDLRSERTLQQVMSPETWQRLKTWLYGALTKKTLPDNNDQSACKHLLVMSGIPIVNADLTLLESFLDFWPNRQRMEDDLKDQWLSRAHQHERLSLIQTLFKFMQETGCRVTLVSGDAHVAFRGYLQNTATPNIPSEAKIINQLTSSAMVNLPPPALVVYMMEKLLAGKTEVLDPDITARLLNFPGTERHILGARNWLSLTLNKQFCIDVKWYVEGAEQPFADIINPIKQASV